MNRSNNITGIAPFASWSTFLASTISVPKGIFAGGIFYSNQPVNLPIHVSYISGSSDEYLGVWGLADSTNTEVGEIRFSYANPNMGDIVTPGGFYGGCIEGLLYNANNNPVGSSTTTPNSKTPDLLQKSDLGTFLYNVHGTHTLDVNSLVFDVCWCLYTPGNETPVHKELVLPEDSRLAQVGSAGAYYTAPAPGESSSGSSGIRTPLQHLVFVEAYPRTSGGSTNSSATLVGTHVVITPWSNTQWETNPTSGVEDVLVTNIDGGIVIGTHKAIGDYESRL